MRHAVSFYEYDKLNHNAAKVLENALNQFICFNAQCSAEGTSNMIIFFATMISFLFPLATIIYLLHSFHNAKTFVLTMYRNLIENV